METQPASVKKIAINFGLLLGLLSIIVQVISYVTDTHIDRPWWVSVLGTVITIGVIVFALKAFKEANGGFLSLGEAIKIGLAISVISGIIAAIFNYIFITVIEPDFVVKTLEFTRENMIEQSPEMTEEQIQMGLDMTEKFMQPWILSAIVIVASLFLGFVISLIAGLVMKQNRPSHI